MNARPHPSSPESERAVLGGLILDPNQIEDIAAVLSDEDFQRPDHAELYRLLQEMRAKGDRIDSVSVTERIARGQNDERYGGVVYVLGLSDAVPSTSNLMHYAKVVRQKRQLCRLIELNQRTLQMAYAHEADPHIIAEHMQATAATLMVSQEDEWISYGEAVDGSLDEAARAAEGEAVAFLPTGITELDHKLGGGLHIGTTSLIAARPGMGKSALVFCVAEHIAQAHGVAAFLAEDSPSQVANRAMARETGIDASDIRAGKLEQREWERLEDPGLRAKRLDIHINKRARFSARDIRASVRGLNATRARLGMQPIKLVVVDYLQLMDLGDGENQNLRVAATSRELTLAAKELQVHVCILSQLNRSLESRADKRPIPSDLRDSGALEQDARLILFPFRPSVYDPEQLEHLAELDIAKNTYGRGTGMVPLNWDGPRTQFTGASDSVASWIARGSDDDWPEDDAPPDNVRRFG